MHPEAPADAPAAAYAAAEQRLRQLQRSPEVFGHPTGTVEWIETHISWLLLAGDFVYKFKKPLKLDFLDFSTPALRRAACEEELRINRRTAPALYLGLVALSGQAGRLQLQPAGPLSATSPRYRAGAVRRLMRSSSSQAPRRSAGVLKSRKSSFRGFLNL